MLMSAFQHSQSFGQPVLGAHIRQSESVSKWTSATGILHHATVCALVGLRLDSCNVHQRRSTTRELMSTDVDGSLIFLWHV